MLSMENVCKDSDLTRKKNITDLPIILPKIQKLIGIAADHGGYELKEYLVGMLRKAGYEVIDFGDRQQKLDDASRRVRITSVI